MLLDIGTNVTIISTEFFENLETQVKPQIKHVPIKSGDNITVKGQRTVEVCRKDFTNFQKKSYKHPCKQGLNFTNQNSCLCEIDEAKEFLVLVKRVQKFRLFARLIFPRI